MGRKTKTVVASYGRDANKNYLITEMSAAQAEKWGMRALLLFQGSGETIPMEVRGLGMVGVAIIGFNAFMRANIDPDKLEPLLDEMMGCVQIVRDHSAADKTTGRPVAHKIISDNDIEEIQTRLWLRSEVLGLHCDFSVTDAVSKLISLIRTQAPSSTTSTSPPPSGQ